jgi:Integrase core domain
VDNVIVERFWRTLKHEHVLLHSFEDLRQARRSIGNFIDLYNHKRLHQSLGYRPPAEVYGFEASEKHRMLPKQQLSRPDGYVDNVLHTLPTYPQAQPQLGLIY